MINRRLVAPEIVERLMPKVRQTRTERLSARFQRKNLDLTAISNIITRGLLFMGPRQLPDSLQLSLSHGRRPDGYNN